MNIVITLLLLILFEYINIAIYIFAIFFVYSTCTNVLFMHYNCLCYNYIILCIHILIMLYHYFLSVIKRIYKQHSLDFDL